MNYLITVPGRNACEIKMVHQEDAGLNVEMAKLAFAKGIWSYVCKMDNALHKYSTIRNSQKGSPVSAITLIQKVRTILFYIIFLLFFIIRHQFVIFGLQPDMLNLSEIWLIQCRLFLRWLNC